MASTFLPSAVLAVFAIVISSAFSASTLAPAGSPAPVSDIHILATPTAIHDGFTKYLTVNCSFMHGAASDFSTIMSIILSKTSSPSDSNYNEIASVTAFSNGNVDVTDNIGATVSGHLESNSESFIAYEWKYPTSKTEGMYKCEAYGMDRKGHPRNTKMETTVTEQAVNLNMVLVNMKHMDNEIDELLQFKQEMMSRLDDSMGALMASSGSYNGKMYYLSQPITKNTAVADSLCRLYGATLVEVDDKPEFDFLVSQFKSDMGGDSVSLGASDRAKEGSWSFLSSGAAVTYFNWAAGSTNSADNNCMYMGSGNGNSTDVAMFADACYEHTFNRFICEI